MKPRVFIDASVFIYAKEYSSTNSRKIVELISNNMIEAIVSAKTVREVFAYFKRHYGKQTASNYRYFLIQSCKVIDSSETQQEIIKWRHKVKNKDLEHIATVKALQLETLVGFDRDFKPFKEYKTPKQFLKSIGIKTSETEY